jgi:hypothetical protein
VTTTNQRLQGNQSAMLSMALTQNTSPAYFVLGAWLFLTAVALGFVTFYGNRTPRWEDWFLVPALTGAQRVNLAWLWESVQGHRIPILKLILLACYSLFGFNSKPILYLNVLLFSVLSLGLIWAIRQVRGRCCYSDAFFPILLLNLGQTEAFSWAQTFAYVATTCLEVIVLILIVTQRGTFSQTRLIMTGVSLILLPLVFGGGLIFAGAMVPWLIYQGYRAQRMGEPSSYRIHTIALASASIILVTTGFYFVGYREFNAAPAQYYVKPGLSVYALTALKYLASAFGGGAQLPWWQVPTFLAAVILATTLLCLALVLVRCRLLGDPRAVGLASYMLSSLTVAWVVGMGRYAWGNTVLDSRYAATSVIVLIGAFFVWELYSPRLITPLGRMLLFTAAASFLHANLQLGVRQGVMQRDAERELLRDLYASRPIPQLAAHHAWVTYYYHDRLEEYLRQLRDAGIAPYHRLPPDPSFYVQTLRAETASVKEIEWNGDTGVVVGPDAHLQFDLPKPEFVSGLRFRFSLVDPSNIYPTMRVGWYNNTKTDLQQYNCGYRSATGQEAEVVVYIDDTISRVLIFPNNRPSTFRISKIELLLPEAGQRGSLTNSSSRHD